MSDNIYHKHSLGLLPGDTIVWRDEKIELEGGVVITSPGITGRVIAVLEALYTDFLPKSIPPRAVVEFENGSRLVVDVMMKWEKALR